MRKIFTIIVLLVASVTLFAQSDVTKFLGIPVDGFKPDMIRKLKEKGFVSIEYDKNIILEGEFNGVDVNVFVVTNNNKVYRIMVCDAKTISETDIRIRFNNLCRQFANNSKYTTPVLASVDDYIISEDEDISYEMAVKNKRYEAIFYQKPDPIAQQKDFENYKKTISDAYTEEELNDSKKQLDKAKKELNDAKKLLDNTKKQLNSFSSSLDNAKKQISKGKKEYQNTLKKYNIEESSITKNINILKEKNNVSKS